MKATVSVDTLPKTDIATQLATMVFPTEQTNLLTVDATNVFQPTASGRPESALYGSTRTGQSGRRIYPKFHEGIDIAACRRDRRGRPLDQVFAIAPGRVAYINRIAGNSNYGRYIVLLHADPVGEVYSMYAHLAEIADDLHVKQAVDAGQCLGVIGNSSSSPMPMARAHLHLEIGVELNRQFPRWYRAKKLKPDHGVYHGWNLLGVDPLAVFQARQDTPHFTFLQHLAHNVPPAFELILVSAVIPDYFKRYPQLWQGAPYQAPAISVTCSENGVPLAGRNAAPEELPALGKNKWVVYKVNREALGRNGARLVRAKGESWVLTESGLKWRDMFLF